MKDIKTTIGGCLLAAGGALTIVGADWARIASGVLIAVGGFLAGVAAKDSK